ncbi:hypothetical protein K461DRAFT_289758 [Myriangium duriaei CBS 260.36]|uniref:YbhB/YbcL family Raf kinase inhibitor-like protein n=1 Tax=Myriangium duriaei CBS 260.36 TaxID=1168546 RepID=A0A9P4J9B4_9PEZI|nr:hypothetical protein K461DRAFT_289758 [Myriangium duriaei CBS 260.36]
MHIKNVLASCAVLATAVLAQSPAGFSPSTKVPLGVKYGDIELCPGEELPQAVPDAGNPSVFSLRPYPATYMILLVDLSIPFDLFPADETKTLVPGLGPNRTTRLHWWQTNVTRNPKTGTFVYPNNTALAPYAGPMPPQGDIFHDYVFWLFPQPKTFVPPSAAVVASYQDPGSTTRFNYSLPALVRQVGNPLAANYMRVENAANPGAPTKPTFGH